MSSGDNYRHGDHNVICDYSGFKVKRSECRMTWQGYLVHKRFWEPRHPQDFVRGTSDEQSVEDARPESADVFLPLRLDTAFSTHQEPLVTSTGLQTLTDTGLSGRTPKASILLVTSGVTADTAADEALLSLGVTGGASQWSVSTQSKDGVDPSSVGRAQSESKIITGLDNSGVDAQAQFTAFSADSTTIDVTNAPSGAYLVSALQIGGADVKAEAGRIAAPIGVGTSSTVTLSDSTLEADVILFGYVAATAEDTRENGTFFSTGFAVSNADGITNHAILRTELNGNSPTMLSAVARDDRCAGAYLQGTGYIKTYEVTAVGEGSFDVTTRDSSADTARDIAYLALSFGGARVKGGTVSSPVDADTDWGFAGVGFKPKFVFSVWSLINATAAYNTVVTNAQANTLALYAFTDTSEAGVCISSRDDTTTTQTSSVTGELLRLRLEAAAPEDFLKLSNPTMTDGGWQVAAADIDTADSTPRQGIYFAVEDTSNG